MIKRLSCHNKWNQIKKSLLVLRLAIFFVGQVSSFTLCQAQFKHEHPNIFHGQRSSPLSMIGTGFSFNDGQQILVSVQKPLGIILEQDLETNDTSSSSSPIVVAEIDSNGSAARAGVQEGDLLLAVQNISVEFKDLNEVLQIIGGAPRVVNLRLLRGG